MYLSMQLLASVMPCCVPPPSTALCNPQCACIKKFVGFLGNNVHSSPPIALHPHAVGEANLLLLINKAETQEQVEGALHMVHLNWLRRGRHLQQHATYSSHIPHALLRVSGQGAGRMGPSEIMAYPTLGVKTLPTILEGAHTAPQGEVER